MNKHCRTGLSHFLQAPDFTGKYGLVGRSGGAGKSAGFPAFFAKVRQQAPTELQGFLARLSHLFGALNGLCRRIRTSTPANEISMAVRTAWG